MTPYAQRLIPPEDRILFGKIQKLLAIFPDLKLVPDLTASGQTAILSCHMLGEALAAVFPELTCYHGYYFMRPYQHSWLITQKRNVIDHYPIGTLGGPLLIEGTAPGSNLYVEMHIDLIDTQEFKEHVMQVTNQMTEIITARSWEMFFTEPAA